MKRRMAHAYHPRETSDIWRGVEEDAESGLRDRG